MKGDQNTCTLFNILHSICEKFIFLRFTYSLNLLHSIGFPLHIEEILTHFIIFFKFIFSFFPLDKTYKVNIAFVNDYQVFVWFINLDV